MENQIRNKLFRKSIHLLGFLVPIISITLGVVVAVAFVISLSALYSISEYSRVRGRSVPIITTITNMAIRVDKENQTRFIVAPLFLAAGILSTLLIFPAPINYAAIAVVTLGDGSASIVGRMYGKNKIPFSNGKTVEGTAAGIICAFIGALLFVSPTIAITAALIGMIVEFLPLRINDNISVPLLAALSMTLVQMLFVGTG